MKGWRIAFVIATRFRVGSKTGLSLRQSLFFAVEGVYERLRTGPGQGGEVRGTALCGRAKSGGRDGARRSSGTDAPCGQVPADGFLSPAEAGGTSEACRLSEAADTLMSAISVSPFGRELPGMSVSFGKHNGRTGGYETFF